MNAKHVEADEIAPPHSEATASSSIITQSSLILDEAKKLIRDLNATNDDKTEYLDDIRSVRLKITKRSPQLRSYLDGLRNSRDRLNEINNSATSYDDLLSKYSNMLDLPNVASSRITIDDVVENVSIQDQIDIKKVEIESMKKQNLSPVDLKKAEIQLNSLERELKKQEEEQKAIQSIRQQKSSALIREREERTKNLTALNKEIAIGEGLSQDLDDSLNILDDISGSLLESYRRSAEYTANSTIVFAVLVGGVILGFFSVAFWSENVRNAIFTGDSGIQFVTMFSLVIAIILFGVLKILEGKELSALLGGLSGYILGRGSLGSTQQPKPTVQAESAKS
jgi:hypothetical protein